MYAMAWPLVMRQMSIGGFASVFMCGTAIARLSRCNSVRLSVCLSVTRVDQSKMVQARIIKFSLTLVSQSVKLFHEFKSGHLEEGC